MTDKDAPEGHEMPEYSPQPGGRDTGMPGEPAADGPREKATGVPGEQAAGESAGAVPASGDGAQTVPAPVPVPADDADVDSADVRSDEYDTGAPHVSNEPVDAGSPADTAAGEPSPAPEASSTVSADDGTATDNALESNDGGGTGSGATAIGGAGDGVTVAGAAGADDGGNTVGGATAMGSAGKTGSPTADREADEHTAAGQQAAAGGAGVEHEMPATSAMPRTEEAPEQADPAEQARTARLAAIAAAKRPKATEPGARSELDPQAQRRNQAREAALTARPVLPRILQVVLAIAIPFILVIGAIKAIASPWFLWLDYHRPGFPLDGFGFTPSERLTYGSYGVDYINNTAPSAYLGGLVDGRGNPLFLDTEVAHMEDVKAVIGVTYTAGIILAVLAVLICLYLGRRYAGGIRRGFFAGSVATIVVMAAVAVLGVLNWQSFFTDFHRIFFSQGNWTFRMDDTLIRLYPPQFWVDAGITIAVLVLLVAIVFLVATWPTPRRRERSRLRQESRDFGLN